MATIMTLSFTVCTISETIFYSWMSDMQFLNVFRNYHRYRPKTLSQITIHRKSSTSTCLKDIGTQVPQSTTCIHYMSNGIKIHPSSILIISCFYAYSQKGLGDSRSRFWFNINMLLWNITFWAHLCFASLCVCLSVTKIGTRQKLTGQ